MSFDAGRFLDPPREAGALKILHSVVENPTYGPEDREKAREVYRRYKAIGYSGVVTNLPFENGYLDNEDNWKVLHSMLLAADDEGMRLWLYDEKGYPSGSAGGKTLRENPRWEAKGLVCLTGYGESVDIPLPRGHWRFAAAFAYEGDSLENIDYGSAAALPLGDVISYRGPARFVAAFAVKPCFEMTHAAQNVHAIRRYIDVCSRDAVAAFIRNTYQAYYDHEKEFFGGRFEAIFTDEPSYMAPYIDNGNPADPAAYESGRGSRWNIPMEDRLDPEIPLCPTLHWTEEVEKNFDARLYPALFGGESEAARRARWRYHREMSRLYGENFFGQIGDWCEAHGIAFSGHILLEDEIKYHPMYEGDFFEKLRHMRVPGIDILYASPEREKGLLLTPKLASSVAHLWGRQRVMSEASAHFERSSGIPVSLRERMCSTAMQYACGVTLINSYFPPQDLTEEENLAYGRLMQRLTGLCEGGQAVTCAALYYPIDSLMSDYLPSDQSIWTRPYTESYRETAEFFQTAALALLEKHVDYDVVNTEALLACRVEKGKLVSPGGQEFRAIVLPPVRVMEEKLLARLEEAAGAGVAIVAAPCQPLGDTDLGSRPRRLLDRSRLAATGEEAARAAADLARPELRADGKWLLSGLWRFPDHRLALLVNTDREAHTARMEWAFDGKVYVLDPATGKSRAMENMPREMRFEPWQVTALWIES